MAPENLPASNNPGGPKKERNKLTLVSVDVDRKIREIAEERLTNKKEGDKKLGFFGRLKKNIWDNNWAYEYRRQKEIARVREEIRNSGSLQSAEGLSASEGEEATQAILARFAEDAEETLHSESGEARKTVGNESAEDKAIRDGINDLFKKFAAGDLSEEKFIEQKNQLIRESMGGMKDEKGTDMAEKESAYADNMLEMAKQFRQSFEHGTKLEELDLDFDIIVGKAKTGTRTEAQLNAVDRLVDKIKGTFMGQFINETTLAAATAVVYSCAVKGGISLAKSFSKLVGPFGGMILSAGIGGATMGLVESKRIKEERAQHMREMAKGQTFDADSKRRQEMEEFRYKTKSATELQGGVEASLAKLRENPNEENIRAVLANLSEIESRVLLSDKEKIDLIGYSSKQNLERERTDIDILRAKTKVELRKILSEGKLEMPWGEGQFSEERFKEFLDSIKTVKLSELLGEVNEKDKLFNSMRRKKVAVKVLRGMGIGLLVGTAAQELHAYSSDNLHGVFEASEAHAAATHVMPQPRETALRHLYNVITGQDNYPPNFHDVLVGENHIKLPEGVELLKNPDGSYNMAGAGGTTVYAENLHFNPNGTLTDESRRILGEGGIIYDSHTQAFGNDPKAFIDSHQKDIHTVVHDKWYDNNTPKPIFDKNELKLWWGGKSGTGIDKDGNFVYNIKHMTKGGSYHKHFSVDAQKAMKAGKLKMLLSISHDHESKVIEVDIRPNGDIVVPKGSAGAELFETVQKPIKGLKGAVTMQEVAHFKGAHAEVAEIVPSKDGVEHFRILATDTGPGYTGHTEINSHFILPHEVDLPPIIPIAGRRPLEPTAEPTPTPPPVPEIPPYGNLISGEEESGKESMDGLNANKESKPRIGEKIKELFPDETSEWQQTKTENIKFFLDSKIKGEEERNEFLSNFVEFSNWLRGKPDLKAEPDLSNSEKTKLRKYLSSANIPQRKKDIYYKALGNYIAFMKKNNKPISWEKIKINRNLFLTKQLIIPFNK